MNPIVYLPIELKYRELSSRLLLTAYLVKIGYAVMLGEQWGLTRNLPALPQGLIFYKSLNKIQGESMLRARDAGHLVAANDEEALNSIGAGGYLQGFHESASYCDIFFPQSEAHRDAVIGAFPRLAGKTCVVGNPRLDILNLRIFETPPEAIASKPYILFNTNFGTINSVWNEGRALNLEIAEKAGAFEGVDRQAKIREFEEIVAWEQKNHDAMTALMEWSAANLAGFNIVIRPHPAEKPGYWQTRFARFPHVSVIGRSDPHPWIENSEIVVHSGCTTGLEAAILRRPVLNLMPTNHPTCDRIVTYCNPLVRDWDSAADALGNFLRDRRGFVAGFTQTEAALAEHLPTARDSGAARRIADALADLLISRGAAPRSGLGPMRGSFTTAPRTDVQRDKFSSTPDEIAKLFAEIKTAAQLAFASRLRVITDNVYLFVPA